jgi:NAD(P)-dependent dehydrogenase (short-subunit alcohol dehydrogenase family)
MPKTIVVTGTATGIGRATVNKFDAEGWNVVATVRKECDLETHSGLKNVKTLLLDVDDEATAVPFTQLARQQFGRVDVLVNNAGYYQMGPLEGTSMEQVRRQYQTNVFSLLAMTRAFLPSFRAQGAGTVINLDHRRSGVPLQLRLRLLEGRSRHAERVPEHRTRRIRRCRPGDPARAARHPHLHQDRHRRQHP